MAKMRQRMIAFARWLRCNPDALYIGSCAAKGSESHLTGWGAKAALLFILFATVSLQPTYPDTSQVALQDSDFSPFHNLWLPGENQILLSGIEPMFVIDILESHGKGFLVIVV